MSERSNTISRLRSDFVTRAAYIRAKIGTLVPSQIRSLRLKSDMPRQSDLARAAGMHQSRISMFETPGAANVTLETLSFIAAALKVGLVVKFVPFSDMLAWENGFSQDQFVVTKIDDDIPFLNPVVPAIPQIAHVPTLASLQLLEGFIGGRNENITGVHNTVLVSPLPSGVQVADRLVGPCFTMKVPEGFQGTATIVHPSSPSVETGAGHVYLDAFVASQSSPIQVAEAG